MLRSFMVRLAMPLMNTKHIHTQRIRQICAFLSAGGGTLQQMHDRVNEGLEARGLEPIGLRTLQSCIERLRAGDFDHSKQALPLRTRGRLFKVVFKHKVYSWAPDTERPEFGDLDEDERFTLPFLAGILKRFESIPSVQKILLQLPEIFNVPEEEMESRSAIFQTGPVLYDLQNPDFEAKVIKCVIQILSHIHHGRIITFNYVPVNIYDNKVENLTLHIVAPLQIRYYEHYYYLITADPEGKRVLNFRIDQIHQLKVEPMEDEDGTTLYFDREAVERRLNITNRMKDSLGVWNHPETDRLHEIHIAFSKWAASYVKRLRLHNSQRIVHETKATQTVVISIKIRLRPEATAGEDILDRNPELSFLLARFGSFCKIVSAVPVSHR
ncbi:MAG: WYL domain-containing protein [Bacteroidota bacterium]